MSALGLSIKAPVEENVSNRPEEQRPVNKTKANQLNAAAAARPLSKTISWRNMVAQGLSKNNSPTTTPGSAIASVHVLSPRQESVSTPSPFLNAKTATPRANGSNNTTKTPKPNGSSRRRKARRSKKTRSRKSRKNRVYRK